MATAADLLKEVADGALRGNIQLKDVEQILGNETFTSDMLATIANGNTLLHLAAQTQVETVLPLVVQAYRRAKLFSTAMVARNEKGWNPLHEAIERSNFENTAFLFKECLESCPEALEPTEQGWTVLHLAANRSENVTILKYLLSKDICQPMILAKVPDGPRRRRDVTPLDIAESLELHAGMSVNSARRSTEMHMKSLPDSMKSPFMKSSLYRTSVEPREKVHGLAKEMVSLLKQPTMEAKKSKVGTNLVRIFLYLHVIAAIRILAKEAEKLAMEIERKKFLEREESISAELQQHLQSNSWSVILDKYVLCDNEETQKITLGFLANSLSGETPPQLPALSLDIVKVLRAFLVFPESDPVLLSTLTVLEVFTRNTDNNQLLVGGEESDVDIMSKVVFLQCSLRTDIQGLCGAVLLNLATHKPHNFATPENWIQPLLLVKHFSLDERAKSLATQTLTSLGVGRQQPDPGSWSVRDVSLWMESNTSLDKRSEYRQSFAEGGIDGLHLLELSTSEMAGLGVKFVSNQRKLSSLIDELRRMNMRSIVGQKDIFLSYAHVTINFARRIKKVLIAENYTVWIDEAGIRAGHKWRNEIADGIQGCRAFLFIMTPRSANSEYCQDELALAEEYKKPIITLRLENVSEMDPGLKLIIMKRQWIDFLEESDFETSSRDLLTAICTTVGSGSGPELEDEDDKDTYTIGPTEVQEPHSEEQPSSPFSLAHVDHLAIHRLQEQMHRLESRMEELSYRLESRMDELSHRLESRMDELSGRVQFLENRL